MKILRGLRQFNKFRQYRISNIRLETFQFMAFVLCLTIFLLGLWIGSANLDTGSSSDAQNYINKFQLFIPVIIEFGLIGFFIFFINSYVKGNIDNVKIEYADTILKLKKEFDEEIISLEKDYEFRKVSLTRELNSFYRENQDLEFLCILLQELGNFPDRFDYRVFCNRVVQLHNTSSLEKELKAYIKQLQGREEVLEGLKKGFTKDENGRVPFSQLVGEACNHALKIRTQEAQEWAYPFYLDMRTYLKAWLTCSIKHGVPIPVEPFFQESLGEEGKAQYHGRETYKEAVEYIKNVALKDRNIQQFFSTSNSRNIVDKYLENLINLLDSDNTPHTDLQKNLINFIDDDKVPPQYLDPM